MSIGDPFPEYYSSPIIPSSPSQPRSFPVNIPYSEAGGVTVAVLDIWGNITIRTGQKNPFEEEEKNDEIQLSFRSFKPSRKENGMTYLSVDRQALINDLKQSVAEIRFQKKDGSSRTLKCTLQSNYLPEEYRENIREAANKDGNPEVLAVWDVEAKAWRSFRLDWVYSIQQLNGY